MSCTACNWDVPLILSDYQNVIIRSRKDVEKDFIQLSHYIGSGKLDSPTPEIRAKKVEQLVGRLNLLKRKIADLAAEEAVFLDKAVSQSGLSSQVQFLVASYLVRCGYEKTAKLMGPEIKTNYASIRSAILSGDLDFVHSISGQKGLSATFSDFLSIHRVYIASKQPSLSLQIAALRGSSLVLSHEKLFSSFLLSQYGEAIRFELLSCFDLAYSEFTQTVSPPLEAILAAGVSALKIPHLCPSTPESCISCLLGEGVPAVHKTRSVLLKHNVEEVYVSSDNSLSSSDGVRIYV